MKIKNNGKDPFFSDDKVITSETIEGDKPAEYVEEEKYGKMEGNFIEKSISKILNNMLTTEKGRLLIQKMIQPANTPINDPEYSMRINSRGILDSLLHIESIHEGKGRAAICGYRVNATYRVTNMNNLILDSGSKWIVLGESQIFKGIDNVLVGMKEGEKRKALIPAEYAYAGLDYNGKKPANPTESYKVDVTLNKIASDISVGGDVRIFDDEIAFKAPLFCGDKASFKAKLMNLKGEIIFDSQENKAPLILHLGSVSDPVIFSHGLFNKNDKGVRTVIFPGKYLNSFDKKNTDSIFKELPKISQDDFYILEFSNVKKLVN
jgi:hypothetical protein